MRSGPDRRRRDAAPVTRGPFGLSISFRYPQPSLHSRVLSNVATCGYTRRMETGIRELKDNLSRYIRRIETGERIAVTAHGRVVAELVPPSRSETGHGSRYEALVATGIIRPAIEDGDPLEGWPDITLPAGTAAHLIDSDRGEA